MKFKKVSVFILAILIMLSSNSHVSASVVTPNASLYLSRYIAYIYPESDEELSIWFEVQGTETMDEIGVLSIRLQEKANTSSEWKTVKTYNHYDYSNLLGYDTNFYYSSVDYSGKEGYSYRADLTIWAGKAGNGDSRSYLTDTVVAE